MNKMTKVLCFTTVCLIALTTILGMRQSFQRRTTYVLPPNISKAFFGEEPEGFFSEYKSYYNECEDFREKASIDSEGNLVLRLTKEQKEALANVASGAVEAAEEVGFEISENYSTVVMQCYADEVYDMMGKMPLSLVYDMATRQLLGGVEPATISVHFSVKDAGTGRIVYEATWPYESIRVSLDSADFSPR